MQIQSFRRQFRRTVLVCLLSILFMPIAGNAQVSSSKFQCVYTIATPSGSDTLRVEGDLRILVATNRLGGMFGLIEQELSEQEPSEEDTARVILDYCESLIPVDVRHLVISFYGR